MRKICLTVCLLSFGGQALASTEADLRKVWMQSARAASDSDHLKRATLLEELDFYNLALEDYIWAAIQNPLSRKALERSGELALQLEREPDLGRLIMMLKKRGLPLVQWPAALKLSWALDEARQGNYEVARAVLPSADEIQNIKDHEARSLAYLHAADILWNMGKNAEADALLQRGIDQKSKIDHGLFYLQRARLYYEQKKYQEAMLALSRLSRTSPSWYGGVIVGAWSAYIAGDYNLTLGQIMTLHSPYLHGKYLPESYVLQAATLYQLCQYQAAKRSLDQLKKDYGSFGGAIDRFDAQFSSPHEKITAVLGYVRGKNVHISGVKALTTQRLMDGIYQDDGLSRIDRALLQVATESEGLSDLFPESSNADLRMLRARYQHVLKESRDGLYHLASRAISRRLARMKKEVAEALENRLPIEVEINTQIHDRLVKSRVPVGVDVEFDADIKEGFEFWPFEGEYWRDEVGSYAFATTGVCREKDL